MSDPAFGPGYEMTLVRSFDAPRSLVFDCFTNRDHLAAWWGPNHFSAPVCEIDPVPGGQILIHMEGPPPYGVNVMGGEFVEVSPPDRLVFIAKAMQGPDGEWGIDNINTLVFEEKDGKTLLTLKVVVRKVSPAVLPALGGMKQGWSESLDKLAGVLRGLV